MKVAKHSPREFADGIKALLPPGAAWEWPEGGTGDGLVLGTAQELARVDAETQASIDRAIEMHRPGTCNFHISEYRRVAEEALASVVENRRTFAVGSRVGDRVWSSAGATFPVPMVRIAHRIGPFRVGSHAGERLWSGPSRFVLLVQYYRSVVDPMTLFDALLAFKQAHVFLWFEDITGVGGEVIYAQN